MSDKKYNLKCCFCKKNYSVRNPGRLACSKCLKERFSGYINPDDIENDIEKPKTEEELWEEVKI